jgi:hypothetical protein
LQAFGGGHQVCFHNWNGDATLAKKAKQEKTSQKEPLYVFRLFGLEAYLPFPHFRSVTFSRDWNPQLPKEPGQHGVVFCSLQSFDDKTKVNKPITFFARESVNNWRQLGDYCIKRWGEISPKHLTLLPPTMINVWVNGALSSDWGKQWVEKTNDNLVTEAEESGKEPDLVEYTDQGLRTALIDGRLVISFTIIECVGYCQHWHDRLEHYRKHPKPSKIGKRKGSLRKRGPAAKAKNGRKVVKEESDVEDSEADYGSEGDLEEVEAEDARRSRRIANLPNRRPSELKK